MVEQPVQVPRAGPAPLPALEAYLRPYASLFRHAQSRPTWESVERYVTGLLTDLPRKNCDTIAAAVAGTTTERLQHLLTDADWDPLALDEARVRHLVVASPTSATGGVLVLDDSGLPKQGKASAGVARQYSGTLGKVANCQMIVSAEYVEDAPATSTPLHWPVTAQLYLHQSWMGDTDAAVVRRTRAHIPDDVSFQTKPEIALALVDRARAWGVPFRHVVADAGYGEVPALLVGLEARGLPYVCGVRRTFSLRLPDEVQAVAAAPPPPYPGKGRPRQPRAAPLWQAETLLECLPDDTWETVAWRQGTKETLRKQFLAVRVHRATGNPDTGRSATHHRVTTGPEGWLLGERPLPGETGERGERKWYFCWLPADTSLERLVALAHARWVIEQFYEDAKGECGLDDYQGRRYDGLHRHLALVLLTYSFLASQRSSRLRRQRGRAQRMAHSPPPRVAGLSPLGGRTVARPLATRTPATSTTPAHLPRDAPPGPPLVVPRPHAVDTHHQPTPPLPSASLPQVLTK